MPCLVLSASVLKIDGLKFDCRDTGYIIAMIEEALFIWCVALISYFNLKLNNLIIVRRNYSVILDILLIFIN